MDKKPIRIMAVTLALYLVITIRCFDSYAPRAEMPPHSAFTIQIGP